MTEAKATGAAVKVSRIPNLTSATGQVQVNLQSNGVWVSNWGKVSKTVSAIAQVQETTVSYDGWLVATIDTGNLSADKAEKVVTKIAGQVERIVKQKLKTQAKAAIEA